MTQSARPHSPLEGEGEAAVGAPGRRVPHAVALGGALPHVLRRPLEGDGVDGEVDALAVAVVAVEEAVAHEELESALTLSSSLPSAVLQ